MLEMNEISGYLVMQKTPIKMNNFNNNKKKKKSLF